MGRQRALHSKRAVGSERAMPRAVRLAVVRDWRSMTGMPLGCHLAVERELLMVLSKGKLRRHDRWPKL